MVCAWDKGRLASLSGIGKLLPGKTFRCPAGVLERAGPLLSRSGAAAAIVLTALAICSEARAANDRGSRRSAGKTATAAPIAQAVTDPNRPPAPIFAVISLASQQIEVHDAGGMQHRSRVSTGQSGHLTPTGVFSVLQRNRYHESNIYSGAPMPYMQRLTWSGIALHEGYVPGYPASHGCIRMPGQFAQLMWRLGRIGMRVVISPRDVEPVSFAHVKLPTPHVTASKLTSGLVQLSAADAVPEKPATIAVTTPYDAARARLADAIAAKAATAKAVKPTFERATVNSQIARETAEALKASGGILADAEEQLAIETFGMSTVQTESAEAVIRERIRLAKASVDAAREAHERLIADERTASDNAFAAAAAARSAREAAEAAEDEVRLARIASDPVTMFVSRRTGKVYVRQGFVAIAEELVEIREPDRPIGTHVFTAIAEAGEGREVRWAALSVPTSGGEAQRKRGEDRAVVTASAGEALDRISVPKEVMSLVSQRLWQGASIIVSDFGLGETGEGTDFVILTR